MQPSQRCGSERYPLLHSTSPLQTARVTPRMGVCTKLGWNRTELNEGISATTSFPLAGIPAWTTTVEIPGLYSEPLHLYHTRNATASFPHTLICSSLKESPFFGLWNSRKFCKLLHYLSFRPLLSNPPHLLLSAGCTPDIQRCNL